MKILVSLPNNKLRDMFFDRENREALEAAGDVEWNAKQEACRGEEWKRKLASCDVCITGWHTERITGALLDGSSLRCIAHMGGSVANTVSEDVFDLPVTVINANDAFGETVAEQTLMLLLIALRDAYQFIAAMKRGRLPWIPSETCRSELFGKTVGILGYGTISRELIKLLAPFRTEVLVYSSHCPAETAQREGFRLCGLDELVSVSDAVIPLSTLTSRSYHILDTGRLRMMKDDAVIVNTGRGALIDEEALIGELKKGRLFAALDVFEEEPLPADSPLRDLPNTVILPHMGGKTRECRKKMAAILVSDIKRITRGEEPVHTVGRDDYRRMSQKIRKK